MLLSDVIAAVESRNNPAAMRFEPSHYAGQIKFANLALVMRYGGGGFLTTATARMIAATSWGMFQIMGEYLYAQGYKKTLREFLADERAQLEQFEIFINQFRFTDVQFSVLTSAQKTFFASRYNGPGNVSVYVDMMNKAADHGF